jgi:AhpD family alkylhydroperoxidase
MLPAKIKYELFDRMSVKTMRYVQSVPRKKAKGLVRQVYGMIAEDFFINGSLTSHSKVPELLAGVWTGGRECILVTDKLDRTTKEAMTAVLSQVNDCAYCGDMLVSLVSGAGKQDAASNIFYEKEDQIDDTVMRERLAWVKGVTTPGAEPPARLPFTAAQMPEVLGSLLAMSHINRVSHVLMDGSPVVAPFRLKGIKAAALRMFGSELKVTTDRLLEPGRALQLLPPAPLPDDMRWASGNPRIAGAMSRWAAVIEQEVRHVTSPTVRELVHCSLQNWQGEAMPLSRIWVEQEIEGVTEAERPIARLALVVAKAPYQVDEALVNAVLGHVHDEPRLIRVLAWAAFSAGRRVAALIAEQGSRNLQRQGPEYRKSA